MPTARTDHSTRVSGYLSVGSEVDTVEVAAHHGGVVINMRSGTWPTAGLHLTPAMARRIAAQLPAAADRAETAEGATS